MLSDWPVLRRILASAGVCLCIGVLIAAAANGFSSSYPIRLQQLQEPDRVARGETVGGGGDQDADAQAHPGRGEDPAQNGPVREHEPPAYAYRIVRASRSMAVVMRGSVVRGL